MASLALIESKIQGLPAAIRPVMMDIFRSFLTDLRLGHPEDEEPSPNFGAHFYEGTTPGTAGDEFALAHSFGRAPYLALPVLQVQVVGAQIVPMTVTRAADARRIYVSSTVEDAPFCLLVEG